MCVGMKLSNVEEGICMADVLNVLVSVDSCEVNYALQSHFRDKFQHLDLVTIC